MRNRNMPKVTGATLRNIALAESSVFRRIRAVPGPNENKMSDRGRGRASLGVEV
jgi:hypothetical protein